MYEQRNEVRLSDVVSDGIEAAKKLLADGVLTTEQLQLPESPLLAAEGVVVRYLDALFDGHGERSRRLGCRVVRWLAGNQIPYLTRPQYALKTGRGTPARADLGAADGTLMVEIGRVPGWKIERAAECGHSLLLVPHNFEPALALLAIPSKPGENRLGEARPELEGVEQRLLVLRDRLLAPYPDLLLWQDRDITLRVTHDIALEAGLEQLGA